jgi:hypothetical protein
MKVIRRKARSKSFEDSASSIVKTGLEAILVDLGFHVVDFSFEKILADPDFRRLILESYANTDVGRILMEAPDLFVMHKKKEPTEGVFFIKIIALSRGAKDKTARLTSEATRVFDHYYPNDRIAVIAITGDEMSPLRANWLGKRSELPLSKMKSFEEFIKTDLQIEPNHEFLATFNKELVKMYRPEQRC